MPMAPHRLDVETPAGVTRVVIGRQALEYATGELVAWWRGRMVFLVSSPTVAGLHAARVHDMLKDAGCVVDLSVPDGETAKSLEHAGALWERMLAQGGKRDSRVVALGGGSVGDLAGFVASAFLRGVDFMQLPTTLLAQVDASVGGKTAIDLPGGKNTVGAFHYPHAVVADTDFLATLPERELRAGAFEVVKMAAVLDRGLFEELERDVEVLWGPPSDRLAELVRHAVELKRAVVEEDPEEGDRRRILNFGHTLGHAIESVGAYRGMLHGEAVGWGMRFALVLGQRQGLGGELPRRLGAVIDRMGLPPLPTLRVEDLLDAMARDKKATRTGLVWALATDVGAGRMVSGIETAEVTRCLERFLSDPTDQQNY